MKNLNRGSREAQVTVWGPVPNGTEAGEVLALGAAGLFAIALTPQITQAYLDDMTKTLPQGLGAGEASLELINVHVSLNIPVPEADVAAWAPVYLLPDKTYTATPGAGTMVGFALEARSGAGKYVKVGLK